MSNGDKIVAEIKPLIAKFQTLSKGNIECIGMLFRCGELTIFGPNTTLST